jgi:hypothetical protein
MPDASFNTGDDLAELNTGGGDEIEEIAAHDLSTIGLDGPDVIPVLAVRWQIAQKLHAATEPPLRPGGENPRYWDLIDLQLLQALTGETSRLSRTPASAYSPHVVSTLATAHHDLPRLERSLHHHGQQPRHGDHRPRQSRRSRPRAHPRHRRGLKAHVFSSSHARPPAPSQDRSPAPRVGVRSPALPKISEPCLELPSICPAKQWPPIRLAALIRRPRDARIGGRGEIAQLVEHSTENRGVGGSSPPLAIARLRGGRLPPAGQRQIPGRRPQGRFATRSLAPGEGGPLASCRLRLRFVRSRRQPVAVPGARFDPKEGKLTRYGDVTGRVCAMTPSWRRRFRRARPGTPTPARGL